MPNAPHVSLKLPILSGGISDQPSHIRHPNQVEDATNFVFHVADGATKRPGTEFLVLPTVLPDATGSGAAVPSAPGTAPATCTHGDHASSYTVAYAISGTDPDGASFAHNSLSATVAKHASKCEWSASDDISSGAFTAYILLQLDTTLRVWALTFLIVPASGATSTALYGVSKAPSGADPDNGTYTNTAAFSGGGYPITAPTISVS